MSSQLHYHAFIILIVSCFQRFDLNGAGNAQPGGGPMVNSSAYVLQQLTSAHHFSKAGIGGPRSDFRHLRLANAQGQPIPAVGAQHQWLNGVSIVVRLSITV